MKTALITGASSGIGKEIAEELAKKGTQLILVARRKEKLELLASELEKTYHIKCFIIPHDLSTLDAAQTLFDKVQQANLTVDILVNNAGRGHYGNFMALDPEVEAGTIQLNVVTLTSLSKLFGQAMVSRGEGYILNIASIAGFIPGPGMAVYNATKAFVLSLSEAVNEELKGTGVSVTASCPGPTESEFFTLAGTDDLKNLKYAQMMKASVVAKQAVDALFNRKPVVVHGASNKAMTFMPRLMPRKTVSHIVKSLMK